MGNISYGYVLNQSNLILTNQCKYFYSRYSYQMKEEKEPSCYLDDTELHSGMQEKCHELVRTRTQDHQLVLQSALFPSGLLSSYFLDSCVELPGTMFVLVFRVAWSSKQVQAKEEQLDEFKQATNTSLLSSQLNVSEPLSDLDSKLVSGTLLSLQGLLSTVPKTNTLCYVDKEGKLITTINWDIEVSYTIYPISNREILLATTAANQTTRIHIIDLKNPNKQRKLVLYHLTETPLTMLRMHCAHQQHFQHRHNVIFLADSGHFCVVGQPVRKLFDYVTIEYYEWDKIPAKIREVTAEVNDASNFEFAAGNNTNLVVWFPKLIITKPIYFYYFRFGSESAKIERVIIPRPQQLKQVQALKLKRVIQQGQGSYVLCLESRSPFLMTVMHYSTSTKVTRFLHCSCDPTYLFLRMDLMLGSITRIIYRMYDPEIYANEHVAYYYHASSNSIVCGERWTQLLGSQSLRAGQLCSMSIARNGITIVASLTLYKSIKKQTSGVVVMEVCKKILDFNGEFATVFMLDALNPHFDIDLVNEVLGLLQPE